MDVDDGCEMWDLYSDIPTDTQRDFVFCVCDCIYYCFSTGYEL